MKETTFNILGMSCTSCAKRIEASLSDEHGVQTAAVNFDAKNVHITYDESLTDAPTLQTIIKNIGYDATDEGMVD